MASSSAVQGKQMDEAWLQSSSANLRYRAELYNAEIKNWEVAYGSGLHSPSLQESLKLSTIVWNARHN
jgi:hypothetical protein